MPRYRFSPYVHLIENHLIPNTIHYAIFHGLTGEMIVASDVIRHVLRVGGAISLSDEDLSKPTQDNAQLKNLVLMQFLIPETYDPWTPFMEQFVVRPIQNPAIAYKPDGEDWLLVRTSMAHYVFSPRKGELPAIIEERMPSLATEILLLADGTRTLRQVFETLGKASIASPLADPELRETLEFLTSPDRQLIKFSPTTAGLDDPYQPFNAVRRSLYRTSRSNSRPVAEPTESIIDFHRRGIEDASWEFDLIEPTINHSLRFPNEALGGLEYGARFCVSTLKPEVLPLLGQSKRLEVLEIGGGTGSFARSFLKQAQQSGIKLIYHILELSPALMRSQIELLSGIGQSVEHFEQDATKFNLPGRKFDLVIANEVVADFPVALVQREPDPKASGAGRSRDRKRWVGNGARYMEKYLLSDETAPDFFLVNVGAFQFVERVWEHLSPSGTLILTEYGGESQYPTQAYHLNHEEFSIHFGHLKKCAEKIGFRCRLLALNDFLGVDNRVPMLDGHEEHIMCLNHVLEKFGTSLPYAALSEREFETRFGAVVERTKLTGLSFSPMRAGFHFGPKMEDFMVLIMNKPQ
jgi:Putative S-adenosyl-L-methionine-dependent methyltransferase